MAKLRKSGLPYLKGQSSPIHDDYFVTIDDVVKGIVSDPDLDAFQKSYAIKHLGGLKGQRLTDFLNKAYSKAFGSDVNTKTPLADFIETIVENRNKRKLR